MCPIQTYRAKVIELTFLFSEWPAGAVSKPNIPLQIPHEGKCLAPTFDLWHIYGGESDAVHVLPGGFSIRWLYYRIEPDWQRDRRERELAANRVSFLMRITECIGGFFRERRLGYSTPYITPIKMTHILPSPSVFCFRSRLLFFSLNPKQAISVCFRSSD